MLKTKSDQVAVLEVIRKWKFMNLSGLMNHTGLTEKEVKTAVSELREKGLVSVRPLHTGFFQVEVK